MLYTDRYPVPTQQMSTDELLAEATRLETAGAHVEDPRSSIDYNRYSFVRRELERRGVI